LGENKKNHSLKHPLHVFDIMSDGFFIVKGIRQVMGNRLSVMGLTAGYGLWVRGFGNESDENPEAVLSEGSLR